MLDFIRVAEKAYEDNGYRCHIMAEVSNEVLEIEDILWDFTYYGYKLDRYEGRKLAMVYNFHVEKELRHNGLGTKLMKNILSQLYGYSVDYIFLVCDTYSPNAFDLEKWYESFGFRILANNGRPLMILNCKQ